MGMMVLAYNDGPTVLRRVAMSKVNGEWFLFSVVYLTTMAEWMFLPQDQLEPVGRQPTA